MNDPTAALPAVAPAGVGFDLMQVELVANPAVRDNTGTVETINKTGRLK